MSTVTADMIIREAERTVHRELDNAASRLRSEAQRFTGMAYDQDAPHVRQAFEAEAETCALAADLILRVRAILIQLKATPDSATEARGEHAPSHPKTQTGVSLLPDQTARET